MNSIHRLTFFWAPALAVALFQSAEARAQLALSELVVELDPVTAARHDVEAQNIGTDVLYVAVAPREVLRAGTSQVSNREDPDPEKLGLMVVPGRMVLDPGSRKLIRIVALTGPLNRERVYRAIVKPTVGALSAEKAGLKVLVGYEILILVRPSAPQVQVTGVRSANSLMLKNEGNASVELTAGKQCDSTGKSCRALPGGRLYVGSEKIIPLQDQGQVSYILKQGSKLITRKF